jgi:hypothetical protein
MSVHYRREGHRSICSISFLGIELTDDKDKVSCKLCSKILNKQIEQNFSDRNNERTPKRRAW